MAIKVFANSGGQITYTAEQLCAALHTFSGAADYIFQGLGNEMAISYSDDSLIIGVGTGKAVVCGRPTDIYSAEANIELPPNSTINIVLRIDLTRPSGQEGYITYVTDSQIKSEDINGNGNVHDLVLGKAITNARGVTSLEDLRKIKNKSGGLEYEVIGTL